METPDLGPGSHRGGKDLCSQRAAGMDHGLPAVHPKRAGESRHDVVGDGEDDQLDLVEDRLGIGEDAGHLDERAETIAPRRIAAGDRVDRPAGAGQRDAECRPDRTGPDDPDDGWLAGTRLDMGVRVVARVRPLVMTMDTRLRRWRSIPA